MLEFVLGYSAGSATASRAAMLARSAAVADGSLHTNRIEDLNERLDSMAIILRALVSLLEERGLSADDLMAKIEELDLADGTADGRVKAGPVECTGCDSKVPPGLTKCQYCGTAVTPSSDHPLDRV